MLALSSTGPGESVSMAKQSDRPHAALMDEHTDAGVDDCQPGRTEQAKLDTHHVAYDE
jgi:hypothetical protein